MAQFEKQATLHVIGCIYDLRVGGAETSLLAEFSRMGSHGISVEVLCLGKDHTLLPRFRDAGIPVTFIRGDSKSKTMWNLIRFLRASDADLVHTMLFWPDVIVRPIARIFGIRVVTTLTNEYYGREHRTNSKYGAPGVLAAQAADFLSSRFACRVRAISQRSAFIMSRRLALRTANVKVIYRGRDLAHLGRRTEERCLAVRSSLGIGAETIFLCVGRHDFQKAHEIAIEAFAQLTPSSNGAVLLLAGRSGGNTDQIEATLDRVGRPSSIRLLGEREDIGDLLAASDVFVMPSRFEGLGGSVIEAMALEVPMILTDIAIFREVSADRAWFFQRDDIQGLATQMRSLLEGRFPPEWATELRARAEEHFSIDGVARDMAEFYRQSVAGPRSSDG
jgi:glycosyltransferase involved in cell wall biosynthesis